MTDEEYIKKLHRDTQRSSGYAVLCCVLLGTILAFVFFYL